MSQPLFEAIKLDRHAIINASAGTGKTYTIQNLYVRLLLELKLNPSQILVLTFTEKATAELREKIRGQIGEALESQPENCWVR
jgi:exodeoxyribonuclease V beta subunit